MTASALLAAATRRRLTLPERGVDLALLDWGGRGPLALLHHANGFCKGTWGLVADGLRSAFRVVAIDARGHGDSSRPAGDAAYRWDAFAEDLAAVAARLAPEAPDGRIAVGIGHSFGGTAMIGAAARRPELFGRLVLVDPVIPPPGTAGRVQRDGANPMADGARRRRGAWPSRDAARDYCRERPFFADWQPVALELYLLDGLAEQADGSVVLKCPGAIEAAVFEGHSSVDPIALARAVSAETLVLWSERGYFPRALHETLAATLPRGRFAALDVGHLVPMEHPDQVVGAVRAVA